MLHSATVPLSSLRGRFALFFLLALGDLHSSPLSPGQMDGSELAAHLEQRYEAQVRNLCGYTVQREYTLTNKHLNPSAHMRVQLIYRRGQRKKFKILSLDAKGIARRSLLTLLQDEADGEGLDNDKSTLSPRNYQWVILGTEISENRDCYKVQMKPKRKSEYLIDGTAWIGMRDFELVRIVGQMSKSPSVWISRPDFEQRFGQLGNFWLPSFNSSKTKVWLLGEADLTVQYSGYALDRCSSTNE